MHLRRILIPLLAALLLTALPVPSRAQEATVLWFPKEPLYRMVDGRPGGLLLPLAERILKEAGLEPKFVRMPLRRVLLTLRDGGRPDVLGLGWYYTPERAEWLRYSLPIYRDAQLVALVRREDCRRYEAFGSFAELSAAPMLRVGVVDGYSYGPYLDGVLLDQGTRRVMAGEDGQLCGMLNARRCDCIIGPQRHLEEDLLGRELPLERFAFLNYPDMPKGEPRYLVFTRETSEQTMERVNAAILKIVGDLR